MTKSKHSLPKTNTSSLKNHAWKTTLSVGLGLFFRGKLAVKFSGCGSTRWQDGTRLTRNNHRISIYIYRNHRLTLRSWSKACKACDNLRILDVYTSLRILEPQKLARLRLEDPEPCYTGSFTPPLEGPWFLRMFESYQLRCLFTINLEKNTVHCLLRRIWPFCLPAGWPSL